MKNVPLPLPLTLALASVLALGAACASEKTCAADQRLCSDVCIAVRSDPANCGACGNACATGLSCQAGACVDCTAAGASCAAEVVAACYNLNQVRPLDASLNPAGPPIDTDGGPNSFARLVGQLYLANSTASSVSTLNLQPPSVTRGTEATGVSAGGVSGDLEGLAAHGGSLLVANAATNTLVVIDPVQKQVTREVPIEAATSPYALHAFDFVGGKAYLTAGGYSVAVVDLSATPAIQKTPLDLTALAQNGVQPGPSAVVASPDGKRVYVSLNDYYDSTYLPVAGAHGLLAVIDPASDTLVGNAVDLGPGCINASGMALHGSTLWVACGAYDAFGTKAVSGGALVPVDVSSATPVVGTPIALADHAATSVVFCGESGYAGMSDSGIVVRFDPASKSVLASALVCPVPEGRFSQVPALTCAR